MKSSSKTKKYGLSQEEAKESRIKYGDNTFGKQKSKSFLKCFLGNLGDPIIKILLGALAVNLFLVFRGGDIIETIGIAISIFLATFISTLSERGSEAAFRRLDEECSHAKFRVWRDGKITEIPIEEIVVGDVVTVSSGEQIPADAFIISGNLKVDQSMITGEGKEIEKICSKDKTKTPSSKSAVFRGCTILAGEADIHIFAVGKSSFLGEISDEVKLETRESPLKIRLAKLAKQISYLGYIAAALISLTYLFNTMVVDSGFSMPLIIRKVCDFHYFLEHLLHAFMLGLTVIVMAVPEGLPMMIAVVLSSNIRRMIKDNVLVRKPVGIEAAGSMNILFTDKTGTLTEGKMSVGEIISPDANTYSNINDLKKELPHIFDRLKLTALFNTSCTFSDKDIFGGNSTDIALSKAITPDIEFFKKYSIEEKIQFDSAIKFSAVHIKGPKDVYLVKGAPEKIIQKCKYSIDKNGLTVPFSDVSYEIAKCIRKKTGEGKRIICIATANQMPSAKTMPDLTFVCAIILSDKTRNEAKISTETLCRAGIQVVMITGDNKDTAEHIAKECGIITKERQKVLTSDELSAIDDNELKKIIPSLAVIARALPSDKSRLVRVSQEMGLVVGMTGDGINDAPALKRTDIGFSMGSGTQVAKEAGDVVVLDDNLSSLCRAVLYGRTIFKSIRKFITLQLIMNFCAVGISIIGPFIGVDAPVTVVQMLWINLIMDTLGGLAFAGEAPMPHYMREPPKRRDEPIITGDIAARIAFLSLSTVALFVLFLKWPYLQAQFRDMEGRICLLTAFFALFIFAGVFHCLNARTDRVNLLAGLGKNPTFILIMCAVAAVQICFVYLGGAVLRTVPLTARELWLTLCLAATVLPLGFLDTVLRRLRGKSELY